MLQLLSGLRDFQLGPESELSLMWFCVSFLFKRRKPAAAAAKSNNK